MLRLVNKSAFQPSSQNFLFLRIWIAENAVGISSWRRRKENDRSISIILGVSLFFPKRRILSDLTILCRAFTVDKKLPTITEIVGVTDLFDDLGLENNSGIRMAVSKAAWRKLKWCYVLLTLLRMLRTIFAFWMKKTASIDHLIWWFPQQEWTS